jgi:hypothetical protein
MMSISLQVAKVGEDRKSIECGIVHVDGKDGNLALKAPMPHMPCHAMPAKAKRDGIFFLLHFRHGK